MRFRVFLCLFLCLMALAPVAGLADSVTYGDTVYVFPRGEAAPATLTVTVEGTSFDMETLASVATPGLPGAVLGIYARDDEGNYVPYADPANPLRPLQITTDGNPAVVSLPTSIDLYIRQEEAPEGYALDAEASAYRPLSLPQSIVYRNPASDMQGIVLTLLADGQGLAGIPFEVQGPEGTTTITTDDTGTALLLGAVPGAYTLRQTLAPARYSIDNPLITAEIAPHALAHITAYNSRNADLTLRTLGLSLDDERTPRLVPIARTHTITAADGTPLGEIASGETRSLPASRDGITYTIQSEETAADGYAADTTSHAVTLYAGEPRTVQTVVQSEKGFFTFTHANADTDAPISGGEFSLEDASGAPVLTFTAGADGAFMPVTPIPAGAYTLRMTHAAEGYLLATEPSFVQIEPYFGEGQPITSVTFVSQPVPASLWTPQVQATSSTHASLFDADADIRFTLRAFSEAPPLPVANLTYTYDLPDIPGLEVLETGPDSAHLRILRRFPLPGVPEITDLAIEGTVSYDFSYVVDDQGTLRTETVREPFQLPVADFARSMGPTSFAASGHVYDEAGDAITGMAVTLTDDASGTVYDAIVADPYGAYALVATPRGTSVHFDIPEGYGIRMEEGDVHVLPLQTVSGRVVTHGPVIGYPVTLTMGEEDPTAPNDNGAFSITGVFTDHDQLTPLVTESGILTRVDVEEDGAYMVHLYAAASVSGAVSDPDGQPVPGATVTLRNAFDTYTAQTEADGTYHFGGLYPGDYSLAFAPPAGYVLNSAATASFDLSSGENLAAMDAEAMQPAAIEGQLLDGDLPYPGIAVTLQPGGKQAITDDAGRYAFERLSSGDYTISLALPEDALALDLPEVITLTRPSERIAHTIHVVRPASISGRVWDDANDDGLLSGDEYGLADVAVTLYDENNLEIETTRTDRGGQFAFERLMPGRYRVGVTLPDGMIFTRTAPGTERLIVGVDAQTGASDWLTLASGQRMDGLICGGTVSGVVDGVLWEDLNGNGWKETTEPALAGVVITLSRDGAAAITITTDANGAYRVENLRAGDYTLRYALPEGCMPTRQMLGSGGIGSQLQMDERSTPEHMISLRRWRMQSTINLGVQRAATLTAHVWNDESATAVNPGDSGYPGMLVELFTEGGSRVDQKTTNAQGDAFFTGLRPGSYRLRYTLPDEGWGFTTGVDTESGLRGESAALALPHGASVDGGAVGISRMGSIRGVLFEDANYDGLRNEGERGMTGAVALLDSTGRLLAETQLASDGQYAFEGLFAGRYIVQFTLPEGNVFTRNRPDAPSFNSDVPESGERTARTETLYLPAGETILIDAGTYRPASVSGSLWVDTQNNGQYTADNPALASFGVTLLQDGQMVQETVTNAQGDYSFIGLPPGVYRIRVALPKDMRFSPDGGTANRRTNILPTEELFGESDAFALQNGESLTRFDVGAVYTGAVSGLVSDMKAEKGLADVSVALWRDGKLVQEMTTGEDGRYHFGDLRPGPVQVRLTAPTGWTFAPGEDSVFDVRVPQRNTEALPRADLLPEATVEGLLWLDANADGKLDQTEAMLSGAAVELLLHEGEEPHVLADMTTDASGAYRFDKLLPGTYSLRYTLPEGTFPYGGKHTITFDLGMGDMREDSVPTYLGAAVAGTVWEDLNNNGLIDKGEPTLEGIAVTLLNEKGGVLQEMETDEKGAYRFEAVEPVPVAVKVALPDGYMFTEQVEGGSAFPRADATSATSEIISLSMGDVVDSLHAGGLRNTRIGDLVWLDLNGNGLQDTGEPGVPGITVRLWHRAADGDETFMQETVTDANGRYRFDAVRPGEYLVAFVLGEDYLPTQQLDILPEINSKLPWRAEDTLTTEPFLAQSGRYVLTVDAGVVTRTMLRALGWAIGDDNGLYIPGK